MTGTSAQDGGASRAFPTCATTTGRRPSVPSSSSPDDRHGLTVPDAYTIALGDPVPHHRQCAVAVWQRFNGANGIVQRAVRRVGGDWQASVDLSVANQDSGRARVAVDARGNAIAVWQHRNDVYDAHWIVTRAVRRVRGEWQAPVDLTAPGQCAAAPEVAVDARGNAVAVWESWYWLSGVNSIVQGAVRRVGEAWQAPVDFSRADRHASGPQVAVDARVNAVAVWESVNAGT